MLSRNENDTFVAHDSNNFIKIKLFSQDFNFKKIFNEFVTNILLKYNSQNLLIDTQNVNSFSSLFTIFRKMNLRRSENI